MENKNEKLKKEKLKINTAASSRYATSTSPESSTPESQDPTTSSTSAGAESSTSHAASSPTKKPPPAANSPKKTPLAAVNSPTKPTSSYDDDETQQTTPFASPETATEAAKTPVTAPSPPPSPAKTPSPPAPSTLSLIPLTLQDPRTWMSLDPVTAKPSEPQRSEVNGGLIPPGADDFFFRHEDFGSTIRLQSRCNPTKTIKFLKKTLSEKEMNWFMENDQFKHIFHMYKERNRKIMGMWMLLLRAIKTDKKGEFWFVVNGIPIRYSLREHALISGLDCHYLPLNYKEKLGNLRFVEKHFGRTEKIDEDDVREKLLSMTPGHSRQRMAVLYFLITVIKSKSKKQKGFIKEFLLKIVDDLEDVRKFPWGTYSFNHCLKQIKHMMNHFKGSVLKSCTFPGFIIPLELLAFECIPSLKMACREAFDGASVDCPRMCRSKYKDTKALTGFPLETIYKELGQSKDICSILFPEPEERVLLLRIMDLGTERPNEATDAVDSVVDKWQEYILEGNSILWQQLHELDVRNREVRKVQPSKRVVEHGEPSKRVRIKGKPDVESSFEDKMTKMMETVVDGMRVLEKKVEDGMKVLEKKVDGLDSVVSGLKGKVDGLDSVVSGLKGKIDEDEENENENENEEEDEEEKEKEEEVRVESCKGKELALKRKRTRGVPTPQQEQPDQKRKRTRSTKLGPPFTEEKKKKGKKV